MEQQRRWLITIIASVSMVFGVLALGKPYWTLETMPIWLALVALLLVFWRGSGLHRSTLGILIVIVAMSLVVARDFGIVVLIYGILAYLAFVGVRSIAGLRNQKLFGGVTGSGCLMLAILGVYWIDVASILIGLLIGPVLLAGGVIVLLRSWRNHRSYTHWQKPITVLSRTGSVAVLMLALVVSVLTFQAINAEPTLDSFAEYDEPLGDTPGRLLRAVPFHRGMPSESDAWRILYTTTGYEGEIVLATGLAIVPERAQEDPLPLILWTHGTTGIAVTCAPTLLNDPLGSGALLFADVPLEHGWAIVAPDYLGLGASAPHPYIVGAPAAHSSLDAVRAVRQLDSVLLSDKTVVWGHSQGGGTALWVGIEQKEYAPDVPLLGVAALAPASNLPGFIDTLMAGAAGPIFGGYIIRGYADWYDDVEVNHYIRPGARFSQKKIVDRCLSEPSFIANIASVLIREPYTVTDVRTGPLFERLKENVPIQTTGVPTFIGQGLADPLIVPEAQREFVAGLCDAGQIVEYHTYSGRDHLGVVAVDSPSIPDLMAWTEARFAGNSTANSCTNTEN